MMRCCFRFDFFPPLHHFLCLLYFYFLYSLCVYASTFSVLFPVLIVSLNNKQDSGNRYIQTAPFLARVKPLFPLYSLCVCLSFVGVRVLSAALNSPNPSATVDCCIRQPLLWITANSKHYYTIQDNCIHPLRKSNGLP